MVRNLVFIGLTLLSCAVVPSIQQQNCLGTADIVMIMDESASVGAPNFELMKNFTMELIDSFGVAISAGMIQMSMMTYGNAPVDVFYLNASSNPTSLKAQVSALTLSGGTTRTERALYNVYFTHYLAVNGRRAGVNPIVILLTDGLSDLPTRTQSEADLLKNNHSTTIFAIGVQNASQSELHNVSSDPDSQYSHYVNSFSSLATIKDLIVKETCSSIPGSAVVVGTIGSSVNLTQLIAQANGVSNSQVSNAGLTENQKVGLGIGVPLALLALAGVVTMGVCCAKGALPLRKKKKKEEEAEMQTGDIGERAAAHRTGAGGTVTPVV